MKLLKRSSFLLVACLMCVAMGTSSCTVHKSEFSKKKWKIKKGYPPVQKYYMKWSIMRKDNR